ncbi:MAG: M56 family metallopeptidase [Acidobacteria bacterium]|nr:M56 family metallopeptidase [Acidobacteriota bacterium]
MNALSLQSLAQISSGSLLNTFAQGLLLVVTAWLSLRILRPQSSRARFAVWFGVLLTVAALPFIAACSTSSGNASYAGPSATWAVPSSWATYIFLAWSSISAMLLLRVAYGAWRVHKLRIESRVVVEQDLDPEIVLLVHPSTGRHCEIRVSEQIRVPAAVGFLRPAVLLPEWALSELPSADLRAVLLHEMAHLRRWDDWTNLAQQLLKAVFFFHPAVWWIDGRLALEREMACDDAVLEATANPNAYARSLLSLAERVHLGRGLALAQAVIGRMRQTSLRIAQILNGQQRGTTQSWKPAGVAAALLSLVVLAGHAYAPRLVTFQEPQALALATPQLLAPQVVKTALPLKPGKALSRQPSPGMQAAAAVQSKIKPSSGVVLAGAKRQTPASMEEQLAQALPASALRDLPAGRQYVFVMQTTQWNDHGAPVLSLCVWRVTVSASGQQQVEAEVYMKSI